jgi:hypothetical protein
MGAEFVPSREKSIPSRNKAGYRCKFQTRLEEAADIVDEIALVKRGKNRKLNIAMIANTER